MLFRSCGISDIGQRRKINEDSFLSDDGLGLYVVADGVGGHAKGEIASAQAVEELHGYVTNNLASLDEYLDDPSEAHLSAVRRMLEGAVQAACYMVFGLAELDPNRRGMSTTMSALLLAEPAGLIAQVGDSRVYRVRDGDAVQLTEDHTLINYKLKRGLISQEEAEKSSGKNVITRAVGHRDYVQVDTCTCDLEPGDRFALCTDGLHGYVHDDELGAIVSEASLVDAAQTLVDLANERGGRDNITVLLVETLDDEPSPLLR